MDRLIKSVKQNVILMNELLEIMLRQVHDKRYVRMKGYEIELAKCVVSHTENYIKILKSIDVAYDDTSIE
jgi:ribulose bisphosphate carboxylase small subunit